MIDFSDDEALAAEYVLGTLDATERAAADARRTRDPGFQALIAQWDERLAPLATATPALSPPPGLFASLMKRLPARSVSARGSNEVLAVRRQLRLWRGATAVATALAAAMALWIVVRDAASTATVQQTYVAVLQHGTEQPSFVVSLDLATRKMTVMPLAMNAPTGKSYELWMIGADSAKPRSMGVVDPQEPLRPRLPDVDRNVLSHATYAVTLEPEGGSPTGQPTSAPLFVGKLMNTAL